MNETMFRGHSSSIGPYGPGDLRPSLFFTVSMALAGMFYIGFAAVYVLDLVGVLGSK